MQPINLESLGSYEALVMECMGVSHISYQIYINSFGDDQEGEFIHGDQT